MKGRRRGDPARLGRRGDPARLGRQAALLMTLVLLLPDPARGAERTDWPLFRGDPHGRAAITLSGLGGEARAWRFEAGNRIWGYQPGLSVWSSAAVGRVAGRAVVLVGSYDGSIYCLDALTGEKRWRFTTGAGVYSTPALWQTGTGRALVFVAASDRLVYALDADLGQREWIYSVKEWRPTMGGARLSSPAVGRATGRDAVFFGHWVWDKSLSGHLQAGGLTALEARTGQRLWSTPLGDNQISSPLFSHVGGAPRVFVAAENGNLYALDADTGRVLWTHTERNAIKASPVLHLAPEGPRLIIGSKYGAVLSLDAVTGREIWRFKTGHWVDGTAAVATVGGRQVVFVGSYDTQLYAIEASRGGLLWSYRTAGGVYSSPAIVEDGRRVKVLVASWDHHLHCVDGQSGRPIFKLYTGRPIWDSVTLGDSIWSSPVVATLDGKAVAFIGSYSGPFQAIPLDEAERAESASSPTNRRFWVTLPLVMLVTAGVTLLLSRRHRQRQRLQGPVDRSP